MGDRDKDSTTIKISPWESKALYFVLAVCGYLIGNLLTTLQGDIKYLRELAEAHSAIIPKISDLEARHDRLEERTQYLEREAWRRNGP